MDPGVRRWWVRDDWCYAAAAAQGEAPLGRDRSLLPFGHSFGTEVPETLNQLCFIHFIQKGSFKIQLRNHAQGALKDRRAELSHIAGGSGSAFNNL